MRAITQWPLWLYQRYTWVWQHALLSAGWAMLYVLCDASVGAFPVQWRVVLACCIFIGGLWRPLVAYALFIAAVAYPLYLISIYVMALALAVLILSAPAAVRFLPQALWVLTAILLAPVHLTPIVPLLAGLWWGEASGAIVGGLAALWLKLCAGMTGALPDLWQVNGWMPQVSLVYERFHTADSLETLVLLVQPLVSDSLALLFNLLQVLVWAAVGFTVGFLAHHAHSWRGPSGSRAWATALALGPGMALIWAGYVIVPMWLQIDGPHWSDPLWLPAQILLAGAIAWSIDVLGRYLQHPVVPGNITQSSPLFHFASREDAALARQVSRKPDIEPSELLERARSERQRRDDTQEGIIMLELD